MSTSTRPGSAGSDRRRQYITREPDLRPKTDEEHEAQMELLIQRAHQRLLERATQGRLTWQGDQIIRLHRRSKDRVTLQPKMQPMAGGV